jgi:putative transposase
MKLFGHRHTIRLQKYNYSDRGWYFITICTQNRECIFGEIIVGVGRDRPFYINLNRYGKIIKNLWKSLPKHHAVVLDEFQIMPNHIHFILHIIKGASRRAPTSLGFIVGIFKTECTSIIDKIQNTIGKKIFQRNYYEHIIRDEFELNRIRHYIRDNPKNWDKDKNNLKSKGGEI